MQTAFRGSSPDPLLRRLAAAGAEVAFGPDGSMQVAFGPRSNRASVWAEVVRSDRVRALRIATQGVTDDELAMLSELSSLEALELIGTGVTGAGLRMLTPVPRLRKLVFKEQAFLPDGLHGVEGCRNLRELRMIHCHGIQDSDLGALAALQALEELRIEDVSIGPGFHMLADFVELRELSLRSTLADDEIMRIVGRLQNLRRLWLDNCPVTGRGIEHICDLPRLEWLNVTGTRIIPDGFRRLGGLRALRHLVAGGLLLDAADIDALGRMTGLESLSLEGCRLRPAEAVKLRNSLPDCVLTVDDEDLWDDELIVALVEYSDEENLGLLVDETGGFNLQDAPRDGDEFCQRFGAVPRVRRLNLAASGLTNAGLARVGGMTWLAHLDIRETSVTAEGLSVLAELPRLVDLAVPVPACVEAALAALGECAGLTRLALSGGVDLAPGMRHLAGLHRLEELIVCTPWGAGYSILRGFSRLRTLHFGNAGIAAVALNEICHLPGLRELAVSECPATDVAWESLRNHPALERVEICRCPVTDRALAVVATCGRLECVKLVDLSIDGEGWDAFQGHPSLRRLLTTAVRPSDAGVDAICRLAGLTELFMVEAGLTPDQEGRILRNLNRARIHFQDQTAKGTRIRALINGEDTVHV